MKHYFTSSAILQTALHCVFVAEYDLSLKEEIVLLVYDLSLQRKKNVFVAV